MKRHTIALAVATAALLLGSVATAESPVVLKARSAVNAIDARARSLKKTHQEKEIGGGIADLTLWKEKKSGKLVRARLEVGGDHGATVSTLYWKDGALLFAFSEWVSEGGANLPPGPEKARRKDSYAERRLYYDRGKLAVVRIRTWESPSGKDGSRFKAAAPNVDIRPGDPRWQEAINFIKDDVEAAQKGNLNDWS